MPSPFFSILIPSYNRPEFILQAVESILANTFSNFEIIISDDKSPRQSEIERLLTPFLNDARITFYKQIVNLGEPENRKFLIEKSKSNWLIFLCDDDILEFNTLETIHQNIIDNSESKLFTFGYNYINIRGEVLYSRKSPIKFNINKKDIIRTKEFLYCDIFPYWFYSPVTFCFNKSIYDNVKPNNKIGIGDDILFLIDAVLFGYQITIIDHVLMSYRRYETSGTSLQPNQTFGILPNLVSRSLIYYNLKERDNLQIEFKLFFQSSKFKNIFLIYPILNNRISKEEIINKIPLSDKDLILLKNMLENKNTFLKLKVKINQLYRYLFITNFKKFYLIIHLFIKKQKVK